MKIILCCSGALGKTVLDDLLSKSWIEITSILTDKNSTGIILAAQEQNIPVLIGNPRSNDFYDHIDFTDVLISVNYLYILPETILRKVKNFALNIHGSLLPKYMGRTPNTWVIINDECETGITVHKIIQEVDAGDIVYQETVPISNTDTAGILTEKMIGRYAEIISEVLQKIADKSVKAIPQDLSRKSYCGKRVPSDGLINWLWSSRKIYNWVRAQTKPYPGAFFFYNNDKIFLWWVEDCFDKFDAMSKEPGDLFMLNGVIYVKCGNGTIKIVEYSGDLKGVFE